ncbi:MAG: glycoside hydrolase family 16 protein [Christensenellaceae bacterium]|jgi:beta-glucanase (GH16 family)|nr:glycoside hydrolase family 16 protein [Christensenellaceae bacterium]
MKTKKIVVIILILLMLFATACVKLTDGTQNLDDPQFINDLPFPNLVDAGKNIENANADGWYEVFTDDFDGTTLNAGLEQEIWTYSPHGKRTATLNDKHPEYTSYWCPDMVTVVDGKLEVRTKESNTHVCSSGICPSNGRFTGGIETRKGIVTPEGIKTTDTLFEQAFGYFETRVKFPKENGLWSAFWLQSVNQGKIGNDGQDGTEIDVYESAFIKHKSYMGHALLWDGYSDYARVKGYRGNFSEISKDFFDGYHTFALKWTPTSYVFYIDGVATWVSNDGGVAKVPEFLRLTVEVDNGDAYGPHGQKIGMYKDKGSVFYVDYVKVYQNKNYLTSIKSNDDYLDMRESV